MSAGDVWSDARPVLERVPQSLEALLGGLDGPWLETTEGPDTFSPREVIGHMADLEATDWVARIQIVMEHGTDRTFDPVDRFIFREWTTDLTVPALLAELGRRRAANLATVDDLGLVTADYARQGRHPALGLVTLGQLISTWVVHDLTHVGQIARVMAKRYRDVVGPWAEYLSILHDRT